MLLLVQIHARARDAEGELQVEEGDSSLAEELLQLETGFAALMVGHLQSCLCCLGLHVANQLLTRARADSALLLCRYVRRTRWTPTWRATAAPRLGMAALRRASTRYSLPTSLLLPP